MKASEWLEAVERCREVTGLDPLANSASRWLDMAVAAERDGRKGNALDFERAMTLKNVSEQWGYK